jgi:hypothetical protein
LKQNTTKLTNELKVKKNLLFKIIKIRDDIIMRQEQEKKQMEFKIQELQSYITKITVSNKKENSRVKFKLILAVNWIESEKIKLCKFEFIK